jgi:hypothetical protein
VFDVTADPPRIVRVIAARAMPLTPEAGDWLPAQPVVALAWSADDTQLLVSDASGVRCATPPF